MRRQALGFTLIELLVTTTIIAVVLGIGIAEYMRFNRSQILIQKTNEVVSDLRLVQGKALAGEMAEDTCGTQPLDAYEAEFLQGSYTLLGACGDSDWIVKTVTLPKGITFSVLPTPNPIQFKVLGEGTNVPISTTITLQGHGATRQITITSSGEIK